MSNTENPFRGITSLNVRKRRFSGPHWSTSSWKSYHAKPRVYIWLEGESVFDNFINRWGRPHKAFRKFILPTLKRVLNVVDDDIKFNWSQKAGCSCGCSPGFIITLGDFASARSHRLFATDTHVTVKVA